MSLNHDCTKQGARIGGSFHKQNKKQKMKFIAFYPGPQHKQILWMAMHYGSKAVQFSIRGISDGYLKRGDDVNAEVIEKGRLENNSEF